MQILWNIPKRGNKIQNLLAEIISLKNAYGKNLKNVYRYEDFTEIYKPSVAVTLYKKSTKVYLALVHFIFLNFHIDFISKKESFNGLKIT